MSRLVAVNRQSRPSPAHSLSRKYRWGPAALRSVRVSFSPPARLPGRFSPAPLSLVPACSSTWRPGIAAVTPPLSAPARPLRRGAASPAPLLGSPPLERSGHTRGPPDLVPHTARACLPPAARERRAGGCAPAGCSSLRGRCGRAAFPVSPGRWR